MPAEFLLTGSSGFLGSIILRSLQGSVITVGRSRTNGIVADLAVSEFDVPAVNAVIHCAGKAHTVPKTLEERNAFFEVNVQGTRNLLRSLERSSHLPGSMIFISSVAVYGVERGEGITEEHPLLGGSPYSDSKIEAEAMVNAWGLQHGVRVGILRLPLIAGRGAPGNFGSMVKALRKGYYFDIEGNCAKKSMVLIDDIPRVIPALSDHGGTFNVTDGYHPTFPELSARVAQLLGVRPPRKLPNQFARIAAIAGDLLGHGFPINTAQFNKITSSLTFDDRKARSVLGWSPTAVLEGLDAFSAC